MNERKIVQLALDLIHDNLHVDVNLINPIVGIEDFEKYFAYELKLIFQNEQSTKEKSGQEQ